MGVTNSPALFPGTLDLLILRALKREPLHGYAIVRRLRVVSNDVLQVGEGSLYPALQRLLVNGWVTASWGTSENNRKARFYELTRAGERHLAAERAEFEQMMDAIVRVLQEA